MGAPFVPSVLGDSLEFWVGTAAIGRATASSTTLDQVEFSQLPGQPAATTFTPADVGCPVCIAGGGSVNPLMPVIYFVQGSSFFTRIAAYVSPTEVVLEDAPVTSIYNTGFCTVVVYRKCPYQLDQIEFDRSMAPGTRDTLGLTVVSDFNPYIERFTTIAMGQPFLFGSTDPAVGDANGFISGGLIDSCTKQNNPGVPGVFQWVIKSMGWQCLALRRRVEPQVAQVISGPGDDVFTKVALFYMSDEGVGIIINGDPSGITVTVGCAAGDAVNQRLDDVCSQLSTPELGWFWTTDPYRNYILSPYTVTDAPWTPDVDGGDYLAGSTPIQVTFTANHDQMANFGIAVGQNTLLNALNATFTGDTAPPYNTPLPLGSVPTITLNGNPQTVGILGVETGKDWYWNQGSTAITQDSSGTPLTSADTLIVQYRTQTIGVAVYPGEESLVRQNQVEGTSGRYDYVTSVTQPILPDDLLTIVQSYVTQYEDEATTFAASTCRPGLDVGQLITVDYPDAGVPSGQYLIATIRMTTQQNVVQWDFTAFGGANIGNAITALVQFINRSSRGSSVIQPMAPITPAIHKITIDHTKVSGGDKTNYVMLFTGTYDFLRTIANGGGVVYSDGADINFSSTQDTSGLLDFELAFYNPVNGMVGAWVRIPTLSSTVDTVIYINYGDSSVSSSLQNPAGAWSPTTEVSGAPNDNWRGVWHLQESAAPYLDSTQYDNDSTGSLGAGYPTRVGGPFGYDNGILIPNTYEGIAVPGAPLVGDGFSNYSGTMQVWLNTTTPFPLQFADAFDGQISTGFGHGMGVGTNAAKGAGVMNYDGGVRIVQGGPDIDDGFWHRVTFTMSPSGSVLYVDGSQVQTDGQGQNFAMVASAGIEISGTRGGSGFTTYVGLMSEPRVTQQVLDADDEATSWNNQSSPSTFYSLSLTHGGPPPQNVNVAGNPSGTVTHTTGALTANLPVIGNGGADVKVGVSGQLVPAGGTTGQSLTKASGTDYDTTWQDAVPGTHSEPLTDGNSNFIFAVGDIIVVVGVPN
jgi:Concanavalin A-like lectin/glucanases superfamily